jgi:superfamily II DNA or RNA helicase
LNNSSDAEQVVGRILRECPGKKVPLVIDMWMKLSYFNGLFWKRHRYYSGERFSVQRMQARDKTDVADPDVWAQYDALATYS